MRKEGRRMGQKPSTTLQDKLPAIREKGKGLFLCARPGRCTGTVQAQFTVAYVAGAEHHPLILRRP
jgi:hypothetical protein